MRSLFQKYPSYVIAAVLIGMIVGWYGWHMVQDARIAKLPLTLIAPSRVTFLMVTPLSGYGIYIISDQPYLIERGELEKFGGEDSSIAGKKRVPIDDLLDAMTGNPGAAGRLIVKLGLPAQDPEKDYVDIPATIPVDYKVLGKQQHVDATAKVPMQKTASAIATPEARAAWEKSLANTLPESALALLNNTEVALTEKHITEAWFTSKDAPPPLSGKLYELHFSLTEAGRQRLLQETSKHLGEQLVIIARVSNGHGGVDSIPVAAPIMRTQLNVYQVDIPNLKNEELIKGLLDTLKEVGVKVSTE